MFQRMLCTIPLLILYASALGNGPVLRDPTKPFGYTDTASAVVGKKSNIDSIKLSSILFSKKRRTAIINDTFVSEGDSIGNYEIISIKPDYVVLSSGGETFTVHLFQNVTTRPGN